MLIDCNGSCRAYANLLLIIFKADPPSIWTTVVQVSASGRSELYKHVSRKVSAALGCLHMGLSIKVLSGVIRGGMLT
jgi:hypothetical protein